MDLDSAVNFDGSSEPINLATALNMMKSGSVSPDPGGGGVHLNTDSDMSRHLLPFLPNNLLQSSLTLPFTGREGALLPYPIIRLMARRSSIVKAPIDFVCRSLATTPYRIRTIEGMRVSQRDIRRAEELFIHPLGDMGSDTFSAQLQKVLRDLMEIDHQITLKHIEGGSLDAFEAVDSAQFFPKQNKETNRLEGWAQVVRANKTIEWDKDQIVHLAMNRRSDSLFGMPTIESIIHEVTATINASRSFSKSLSENDIPPGFLVLMGLDGTRQLDRMQKQLKRDSGISNDYKLRVLSGVTDVKWVQLQREWREMQVAELLERIERIIFRAFGVDRIAMGSAADVNRSTAEAMVMTRHNSLFKPILDMLADAYTYEVLHEINPGLFIEFIHFARTGDMADLSFVTVRPTGQMEDITSMDSDKPAKQGDEKKMVSRRLCGGCEGTGDMVYNINGRYEGQRCPDCGGTGFGGPLFVSRPRHMVLPTAINQIRRFNINPAEAWESMATSQSKELLRQKAELISFNIRARLEAVDTEAEFYGASKFVDEQLTELLQVAQTEAVVLLKKAGRSPVTGNQILVMQQRVHDLVRFQMNGQMRTMGRDASLDDIHALCWRSADDAAAICARVYEVAGRVLADSLSIEMEKIGHGDKRTHSYGEEHGMPKA